MSCNGFIGTFLGRVVAATCLFGSMGLGYIPLCTGASVGITKAAMVHQHDLSSHQTARDRRDLVSPLVSPLEPQSEGFIGTFPESRGG